MKDNKTRALQAMLECPTITAAAKAADLSRQQLYNYLADKSFRDALRRQREAQALERAEALSAARETALKTLTSSMQDKDTPAAARILAAKEVLKQAAEADAAVTAILNTSDFESNGFDNTLQKRWDLHDYHNNRTERPDHGQADNAIPCPAR